MPSFDPLTWAIGFALTTSSKALVDRVFKKDLPAQMAGMVATWADELPPESWVHPGALFPDLLDDSTLEGRPDLKRVRARLRSKQIPDLMEWEAVLFEQWSTIRDVLKEDGQPFFQLDDEAARPHLRTLAQRIYELCAEDQPLFNATVLRQLDELLRRATTGSTTLLPRPLTGTPGDLKYLALSIEQETDSRIHVTLHDRSGRTLFVCGEFPGLGMKEIKWTLLGVARLASAVPGIEEVIIVPSEAADLPRTDGGGPIGVLRICFPIDVVQQTLADDSVRPDLWNHVRAAVVVHENTPFEQWDDRSFRQLEDEHG